MDIPRPSPPVLAGIAALAQLVLARGRGGATGSRRTAATGALVAAALAGTAVVTFHRAGTTVDPRDPSASTALVRGGPFALTRNPMYVGVTGALLCHALARRSWAAALPAVGFLAAMDRLQIPAEEQALRRSFGADFEEYAREVPRWGPPRRRGTGSAQSR
jgi:protein-S-isoprenylcysteine O-methyltransferase Ste14